MLFTAHFFSPFLVSFYEDSQYMFGQALREFGRSVIDKQENMSNHKMLQKEWLNLIYFLNCYCFFFFYFSPI